MTTAAEPERRTIFFAGRAWWVKQSSVPVGPGDNRFDDTTSSVEVHPDGSLSLRVRRNGDRWTCAEVVGLEPTGLGSYEWTVRTDLCTLERRVVCGMFTWNDADVHHHREMDIEVSAWGRDQPAGGQFVVQPWDCRGHLRTFSLPSSGPWTCSFDWMAGSVTFRAGAGPPWRFADAGVPPPGPVHPRINLWLYRGLAPETGNVVEVRFDDFRFTPGAG